MIGGEQEAAGEERVREGSVQQEHPEGLDDAVLEELLRDEEKEQAPDSRPEEGESEDLVGEQPNGSEPAGDAPGEEAPQRRELRCPIAPSQQEFDDHCRRGHVVYRDWCPVCVRSRGREDPHRRNEELHVREGVPVVCMDYKTIKKGKPPWMVLRDQGSRCISSHQARCKGPQDRWLVERVVRDIENLGHGAVTLKGDNEPAMQQFLAAIKNRRAQRTLLEGPPAVDPQANGAAEKAVQDLVGEARSLKLGLEYRVRRALPPDSAIMEWIPPHAGWIITHERVGPDGRTPIHRLTGRPCRQTLAEFGEQVWAKPLRRTHEKDNVRATLAARWVEGTWVGVHDRTGEHIVISKESGRALKVRTI